MDISLKPMMAMCEKDTVAARLEALAEAGLCGGFTWEVSNVDRKFPAGERRLHGIECVPETMIRAARVLCADERGARPRRRLERRRRRQVDRE